MFLFLLDSSLYTIMDLLSQCASCLTRSDYLITSLAFAFCNTVIWVVVVYFGLVVGTSDLRSGDCLTSLIGVLYLLRILTELTLICLLSSFWVSFTELAIGCNFR